MTPINDPSIVPQRPGSCNQAVQDTDPASQTHIKETGRRIMSDKPRQRKEEFHVEEYYVNEMNQSDQKLETRYIYKFDPGLCSKIYRHFKCPIVSVLLGPSKLRSKSPYCMGHTFLFLGAHQNPFGRSDSHVLTGNGSSTYPGFERRISNDKNERESRKLTDKLQEFKICGRPKQISKQKSFDDEESGRNNNLPEEDQLGPGSSKLPFPGCEDFDARIVEVGFQVLRFSL